MNANAKFVPKPVWVLLALALAAAFWASSRPRSAPPAAPNPETPRRALVQKDGHWYRLGDTNRFTGLMVDTYPDGARLSRCQMADGLLNGLSETWYTNGQLQVREHFKEGVSDGLREKWYANGVPLSRATIVAGKVSGTFQSWHENGQLCEQIEMRLGQPDGTAYAYYPSGFVKAETQVRLGQVLSRKVWNDGEQRGLP